MLDNDVLRSLVEDDPKLTLEEMADALGCIRATVQRHLHEMGKACRSGVWVPHELSEVNRSLRTSICNSLVIRQEKEPFLHQIVTGDEKWVLYENPKRGTQWFSTSQEPIPTHKPKLNPDKVLLSVW